MYVLVCVSVCVFALATDLSLFELSLEKWNLSFVRSLRRIDAKVFLSPGVFFSGFAMIVYE